MRYLLFSYTSIDPDGGADDLVAVYDAGELDEAMLNGSIHGHEHQCAAWSEIYDLEAKRVILRASFAFFDSDDGLWLDSE